MLSKDNGRRAVAKCQMCREKANGVTFDLGLVRPHLCTACIVTVRDALNHWLGELAGGGDSGAHSG